MKRKFMFFATTLVAGATIIACTAAMKQTADTAEVKSLAQVFSKDFLIGTALNEGQINERNPAEAAFFAKQFNVITAENIMKSEVIHPTWGNYRFEAADKLMEQAARNNHKVIGHTLLWHSQLPAFVRQMRSKDSLQQFVQEHIATVAGRYKGKIHGWDVVNEALNEDGTMRNSVFLRLLGPDFVTEAFRLAQQADPQAELYYNDYNIEQPNKRRGALEIVKKIQAAGVRIDGVGIQGHWHTGKVNLKDIEESIEAFAALGVKVMITELDLEVLPRNFQGAEVSMRVAADPALNPYVNGLPDSVQQQQAKDYENLFKLFLKHKDKVSRITFWGVHDGQSWLNGWPVRGRTNYPLLFDRNLQPKAAYYSVVNLRK
jgi:endo-1,4-beta-xylanase